ncbi:MAG: hypothetical protein RBS68_05895 [Anaerolineales bacterium]|jgi:hypothetical protein|nr:hypothetical protein [Anaerolineales bacterium]
MKTTQKFFLVFAVLALALAAMLPSASANAAAPAPTPKPKEIAVKLATVNKAMLVSTAPYTATVRITGSYTCDKIRVSQEVVGKTIYINIWDTKNRGSDCNNKSSYSRTLEIKPLVPGVYTVKVNLKPETGKAARQIKKVIVPVGETATPAPAP